MKTQNQDKARYNAVMRCENCRREFKIESYRLKTARFCSLECSRDGLRKSPAQRFWAKVNTGQPKECWLWTGSKTKTGVGNFYGDGIHRTVAAHRFAFQIKHGPIPSGAFVCHTCDNPSCCNPSHLFLGDAADNAHDMISKGRKAVYVKESYLAALVAVAEAAKNYRISKLAYLARESSSGLCDVMNNCEDILNQALANLAAIRKDK